MRSRSTRNSQTTARTAAWKHRVCKPELNRPSGLLGRVRRKASMNGPEGGGAQLMRSTYPAPVLDDAARFAPFPGDRWSSMRRTSRSLGLAVSVRAVTRTGRSSTCAGVGAPGRRRGAEVFPPSASVFECDAQRGGHRRRRGSYPGVLDDELIPSRGTTSSGTQIIRSG